MTTKRLTNASKKTASLACLLLSIFSAWALGIALPLSARDIYSFTIFPACTACGYFVLFRYVYFLIVKNARFSPFRKTSSLVLIMTYSLLVSSCFVVGAYMESPDPYTPDYAIGFLGVIGNSIPVFCIFSWLLIRPNNRSKTPTSKKKGISVFLNKRKYTSFLLWLLLLVCWLPIFLACFPGNFCYDAGNQYSVYAWSQYSSGNLNNHHPVLHTLLLGSVISLGENLFGSFNAGIASFVVLQSAFVAFIFVSIIKTLVKDNCPNWLIIGSIVYFALNPIISMFVLCSTKDVLFSAFAMAIALLVVRFFKSPETLRKRDCLLWVLTSFLFCCFRVNGVICYVLFILTTTALLLINHRYQTRNKSRHGAFKPVRFLISSALSLLLAFVWLYPISTAMNVKDSAIQAITIYSIPGQQMAYLVASETLSDSELLTLRAAGYQTSEARKYKENLSDMARKSILEMDRLNLLQNYIKLGLKYPNEYAVSLLYQTEDAWNPYSYIDAYNLSKYGRAQYADNIDTSVFALNVEPPGYLDSKLPDLHNVLTDISKQLTFQKTPFLGLLVSVPFYMFLLLTGLFLSILRRDCATISQMALFAIISLSVLLGPCVLLRYYLVLIFGAPIIVKCIIQPNVVRKNSGSSINAGRKRTYLEKSLSKRAHDSTSV